MQTPLALLEASVPWNVPLICTILGGVLLVTGILGDKVRIKDWLELPKLDTASRVIAGVVGAVLLGISIWLVIVPPTTKAPADGRTITLTKQSSCHTKPSISNSINPPQLNIVFVNVGTIALKVYWIDSNGNKAQPFDLGAGGKQPETSYQGHQWVFEDADGKCVSAFTVPDHDVNVEVGGN